MIAPTITAPTAAQKAVLLFLLTQTGRALRTAYSLLRLHYPEQRLSFIKDAIAQLRIFWTELKSCP